MPIPCGVASHDKRRHTQTTPMAQLMNTTTHNGENDTPLDNDGAELPLIPGTEKPRSLGDLMREVASADASATSETADSGNTVDVPSAGKAASTPSGTPARRQKKPGRSQARRHARERALQALYQWDLSGAQASSIRQEFLDTQEMGRVDVDYFVLLFNGVSHDPDGVDAALKDSLDRPILDLDPVERAVLRIAAFELTQRADIPARVIINEGIEITKRFGADKGHHYVNGVLDKLAKSLRASEMRQR